jgi:hypothetical protein
MKHKQTNASPNHAVFLGMRIDTSGDFVQLRLQPKGTGWKWKLQRYVEWTSIHTSHTKKFLLKGLLVRAGTITNTMAAFREAVEYYVVGLHARGFGERPMIRSYESYMTDCWAALSLAKKDVRDCFHGLLNRVCKPAPSNQPTQNPRSEPVSNSRAPEARGTTRQGSLLCGLAAINYILAARERMPVQRDILDEVAQHVSNT